MSSRINLLIHHLQLQTHPEGGYFKETYRSEELLHSPDFGESRNLLTNIYFLITSGNFSAFHRINSDELWYFHEGDSCIIHVLHQQGGYSCFKLGSEITSGETYQATVKAGDWFASESTGNYSLVGCAVAPGFDFSDFEMADRKKLILAFPEKLELIERLTRV